METVQTLNRFSTLTLNSKLSARNRVVVPPMASQTATTEGIATQKTFEHYARLTQAGAGLLFVEYTFVHPSGRSEENQLGISTDEHIAGLRQVAGIIHKAGAIAGLQLSHGGGKSERNLTGGSLMSPSGISVPVRNEGLETPDAMSVEDILLWKNAFVSASERAVLAGFDLIELHAAHGYGLNQFLSPITNQRLDGYGGDLLGRSRLLLEIVTVIRQKFPELLISVRMPGQDFFENGLLLSDTIALAQLLEKAGANLLHVSSGIGGWRGPSARNGTEGYLVAEAAQIQAYVKVPVIGVGGIQTAAYMDKVISEKTISLVAVGRAILSDPLEFYKRIFTKEECYV